MNVQYVHNISKNGFRLDMVKRAMPMDPESKPTLKLLKLSWFPRGLFEDGSVSLKFEADLKVFLTYYCSNSI